MSQSAAVDVIVIGAGLAGLTAAYDLASHGLSVIVVEANDRVGGKTYSPIVRVDGKAIAADLGAQWIGPTQDAVIDLIKRLEITTFPQYEDGTKIFHNGKTMHTYSGLIPKGVSFFSLIEVEYVAMRKIDSLCTQVPLDDPYLCPYAEEWDSFTLETWLCRTLFTEAARELFRIAVRLVNGTEPCQLSFLYFLYCVHSAGGLRMLLDHKGGAQESRLVGGAQQLSEKLAQLVRHKFHAHIELSCRICEIVQPDAATGSSGPCGNVVVISADGRQFFGRHVIVTIPPSALSHIVCTPPLPTYKQIAGQRGVPGAYCKCLAYYKRAFWREAGASGEVVAMVTDPERQPVSMVVDIGQPTELDGGAGLAAFIVGDAAVHWAQRPKERRAVVLAALVQFFGPEAAEPLVYIDYHWSEAGPSIEGAPGDMFPPGIAKRGWAAEKGTALRCPFGAMHFAGTDTAERWVGYMDGAVRSGHRAANEVLTALAMPGTIPLTRETITTATTTRTNIQRTATGCVRRWAITGAVVAAACAVAVLWQKYSFS